VSTVHDVTFSCGQNLSSAEASVSSNAPTRAAGAAIIRS